MVSVAAGGRFRPAGLVGALLALLTLAGCSSLRDTAKYALRDGTYALRRPGLPTSRVYLEVADESLTLHPLVPAGTSSAGTSPADTVRQTVAFPRKAMGPVPDRHVFSKSSFDVDVLTIPFKLRPAARDLPSQLTTSFSGSAYVGYRRDRFRVRYQPTPIGTATRQLSHYGFSAGGVIGLGSAAIGPSTTAGTVTTDYEGVVLLTGVGALAGIENLTFGAVVGTDHLLDRNRRAWRYAGRPWLGFALGLNLN